MLRIASLSLIAVAVCSFQSGCCCCRLPFLVGGGPKIVMPPPVVQPPVFQPPIVEFKPKDVDAPNDLKLPKDQPAKDLIAKDQGQRDVKEPKDIKLNKDLVLKDLVFKDKDLGNKDLGNKDPIKVTDLKFPPKDKTEPAPLMKIYVYSQSTGEFKLGDELLGVGFSGTGAGKNNPALQDKKGIGPIPVGEYSIIGKGTYGPNNEPTVMTLPAPSTKHFGRFPAEQFSIMPDTGKNVAGDIVLPRAAREKIENKLSPPFNRIKVVP